MRHGNSILRLYAASGMLALFLAGCGGSKGPPRFELSGTVTYDGKPVPGGCIVFAPDKSHGNDGPSGVAEITDGNYRTEPNAGTIGGPHIASISGIDVKQSSESRNLSNMGNLLFKEVQVSIDLPMQASTHDFAIPKQK